MINVQDVVSDPDLIPSEPFTILRSTVGSQFVAGGFESVTFQITMFAPAQQAQPKEIAMLPEADRVGSIRAFWSTIPLYTTRGYAPAPVTHGETAVGSGSVYTLSTSPPGGACQVYVGNLLLRPGVDYQLSDTVLTMAVTPAQAPYVTWLTEADVQQAAADKILFEGHTYRVLSVYHDTSTGYWRALGTREEAA